jgi:Tat protein secretion system quality control protein TatD with DNase activity
LLIDAHAHLDHYRDDELDAVLDVATLAELRGTTPAAIEATVQSNFARLIRDDRWLSALHEELF